MPMSSTSLRAKPIEVPEPDLTPKEIIARAATLREHLRDDQEATEQRTYYSARTHELFGQAGLYRILQPRRFGGYEFDIETFYRVVMELARGCPSTGWCFCLGAAHVLQVAALFPEEGQQEIFAANDGHFVAASRDLPAGTVTPSGDGYVVSGAHSIQVKDATVPAHFVVDSDPFSFDTSNAALRSPVHPNPMYNSRHLNFFHGEIGAIMTGMADAATDEFERIIRTSKTSSHCRPGCAWTPPTTSAPSASASPRRALLARSFSALPASTSSTAARRPRTASPTRRSRTCSWN